ncbi:hypothetical protein [Marinilabilia rubra]|uniref:Lipoprotein n=1 Tax=Marinilabilia rubra TaxID=2162893 RepID=A0A2U2B6I0_9BACT|nr:hypothetical protein [Marinilabilia rubra]PWD98679.1 hypothetical protein DDZ16_14560 [Marinilabilia rubra]
MKATTFLILTLALIITGCSSRKSSNKITEQTISVNLKELLQEPGKFTDREVNIKGLCIHTCRKSGKKLFLQGNTEDEFLKVIATDQISTFDNSLEGEEIIVNGLFISNNTSEEHKTKQDKEHTDSCASEQKAQSYILKCYKVERANVNK